ncbi:glycosyltransferase [Dokdonia sp.]|uniref:glycosyltransferase n=1 Tax=Dokdonia sp. TaxID=2024995 RepID=UPI003265D66C
MSESINILVAPLNWGLGHATRCIPIIRTLQQEGYTVIIASDGEALTLLDKEFPELSKVSLPSYDIEYAKKKQHFKRKMISSIPKISRAIRKEHKALKQIIATYNIKGVISDNRLGLYTSKIPTIFITHQLQILSGKTTATTTFLHKRFIKRFNECWVPDYMGSSNLSGILGHPTKGNYNVNYIGPLSRMKKRTLQQRYDVLVVLSGPEPQKSILEAILLKELKKYNGSVLFIQGRIKEEEQRSTQKNIEIVNFLTSEKLSEAINSAGFIIARSGYTTIMDLAALQKKAFFIPTPGQTEQEYLAQRLKEKGIAPYSSQDTFKVKDLTKIEVYSGFNKPQETIDLKKFFGLFKSE